MLAWSIWVGIAVSARCSDPRTAGQVALLLSLPTVAVTTLIAFGVIPPNLRTALGFGILLLLLIRLGWRVAAAILPGPLRLITGSRG